MQALISKLFEPVSIKSLVFFRIAFGIILVWRTIRMFYLNQVAVYWIYPEYNFKYDLFTWVNPLPDVALNMVFALIGLAGVFISLGYFYKFACSYAFVSILYFFLLEETRYLNHTYLVILMCFLMIFLPLNQYFSLDARFSKKKAGDPSYVPRWVLFILQFQIAMPYFFGGVAKLQPDWLRGQPMKLWLSARTDFPLVGSLFTQEWVALFASYASIALDIFAAPFLIIKATRPYAFIGLTLFHLLNSNWFGIGIFPWFMIVATTLFLDPDWPEKLIFTFKEASLIGKIIFVISGLTTGLFALRMFESLNPLIFSIGSMAGLVVAYLVASIIFKKADIQPDKPSKKKNKKSNLKFNQSVIVLLSIWMSIQILLPLRNFIIPGDALWTEEGHRFAWRMLLRTKYGNISYIIDDLKTGERIEINAEEEIESWQYNRFGGTSHLIHEYAKYLVKDRNPEDVRIRAQTSVSLNGRDPQPIMDSSIDLSKENIIQWHADWILPLRQPLK